MLQTPVRTFLETIGFISSLSLLRVIQLFYAFKYTPYYILLEKA